MSGVPSFFVGPAVAGAAALAFSAGFAVAAVAAGFAFSTDIFADPFFDILFLWKTHEFYSLDSEKQRPKN